jgi:hypothetical protein
LYFPVPVIPVHVIREDLRFTGKKKKAESNTAYNETYKNRGGKGKGFVFKKKDEESV